MSKQSISVVIPNYNGRTLLEENLPSVFDAIAHSRIDDFEIIVADDASTDDSVAFLKAKYPGIISILNSSNLGFSGNINTGLKAAKKHLVLALNSDVRLNEDYFVHLLEYFDDLNVFAVAGAMIDPVTDKVSDTAKYPDQTFFGLIKSTRNVVEGELPLPTFFASGANALMDRKKLEKIGWFSELFSPFYGEDVELGLRAWRMGWKSYFEPRAKCYHKASSTILTAHKHNRIRRISRRNRIIFHDLHLSSAKRTLFFIKLGADLLLRWIALDFGFYLSWIDYLKRKDEINSYKHQLSSMGLKYSTAQALLLLQQEFNKAIKGK